MQGREGAARRSSASATPTRARRQAQASPERAPGSSDHDARARSRRSLAAPHVGFPVYYPRKLVPGSLVRGRAAHLHDRRTATASATAPTRWSSRTGCIGEYYGVKGTSLAGPADPRRAVRDARRSAAASTCSSTTATALRLVGWKTAAGVLLDLEHAAPDAVANRGDARRSRARCGSPIGSASSLRAVMSGRESPIGVIGVGWVGLVTAACFAELGHDVWCVDIDAAKIARLARGEVPIYEPGLEELVASNREPPALRRPTSPPCWSTRGCCSCASDTPPTYSGDADLSRVEAVVEELPASDRARDRDEEHRAGRHRRERSGGELAELGKGSFALRLEPRVPEGGLGGRRTSCTPTASSSATTATGRATRSRRSTSRSTPDRAHRRRLRRDDQARLERLPGDQDLLHQRDRQRLRGDRRRRRRGRARHGPRPPHRHRSSCNAGIGFGGSCFPKDVTALKQLAGNSGYHFQLLTR